MSTTPDARPTVEHNAVWIGIHPGCGGWVEIVEYAAVCQKCDKQDWTDNGTGDYEEGLLERAENLPEGWEVGARICTDCPAVLGSGHPDATRCSWHEARS